MRDLSVVFLYHAKNRYGFNALAASVRARPGLERLPLLFVTEKDDLGAAVAAEASRRDLVVCGFSLATEQLPAAARTAAWLKKRVGDKVFLLAGGPHPTGDPAGTLAAGFDAVLAGEGEESFPVLLEALAQTSGLTGDLSAIPGLAVPDGRGGVRRSPPGPPVDLDRYPPYSVPLAKVGPIEITRGCPHACGYCQTPRLFGRRVRHRSVAAIRRAIEEATLKDIRFVTPNAFAYGSPDGLTPEPAAVRELLVVAREAAGPGGRVFFGSFPSEVRPEHVTPELLATVREYASNDNIVLGAQSGSPAMLARIRRGHTVEDVVRAVELIVGHGFKAYVDFIFGLPGETEGEALESLRLMRRLLRRGARIHAHSFMPLPGTPLAGALPSPIAPAVRAELLRLVSQGHAFGNWLRQERTVEACRGVSGGPAAVAKQAGCL